MHYIGGIAFGFIFVVSRREFTVFKDHDSKGRMVSMILITNPN